MNMRMALLTGLLSVIPLVPAAAAEKITVSTGENSADGVVTRSVNFMGACGEECFLASLSCSNSLAAELIDIPSDQAAKAVAAAQSHMILKAGGKTYEMPIESLTFSEMNGSWDASARAMDSDAIYKGLGAAKSFTLSVAGRSEKLPVTKEVLAWAKACLN